MARVKGALNARKKHKKVLKMAKGYYGTFFKRFKGLMGRKSLAEGAGLLIEPCNQIHTFGMKFAIDTLTLDKDDVILYIDHEIQPGKIRKMVSKGRRVLELPSGTANKYMLQVGQVISVE